MTDVVYVTGDEYGPTCKGGFVTVTDVPDVEVDVEVEDVT